MKIVLSLVLLLLCTSCRDNPIPPIWSKIEISGRLDARPLYSAKLPHGWTYKTMPPDKDTRKALAEFYDATGSIRLTFHNFPLERIPPMAQVVRWKGQFAHLDPSHTHVKPQAFSGFIGYFFEGTGTLSGENKTVLGWAMELSPEHVPHLNDKEMSASFTLKATGPKEMMAKQKKSIIAFARSFGLIDEIPSE